MTSNQKILQLIQKILSTGGGVIAFGISAIQTTLISFHIAHNYDQKYLAVFSFLFSILYFSIQLLRRNVIEPFFQEQISLILKLYRIQVYAIVAQALVIFAIVALVSGLFKLSGSLLLLIFSSLFWEIRKAELRKAQFILRYTYLEFFQISLLIMIMFGNLFGFVLPGETAILVMALLQSCFIIITKKDLTSKHLTSTLPNRLLNASAYSFGEYVFVVTIIVSNLFLISISYANQIGEIRAVFLMLTVSTFSIGALRHSLATEMKFSGANLVLMGLFLINIICVYFLPLKFVKRIIPSIPDNFHSLLTPILLDIFGSLIFAICSLQLLRHRDLLSSSKARIYSALVIISSLFYLNGANLDAMDISLVYALASIIGAFYLGVITLSKQISARRE